MWCAPEVLPKSFRACFEIQDNMPLLSPGCVHKESFTGYVAAHPAGDCFMGHNVMTLLLCIIEQNCKRSIVEVASPFLARSLNSCWMYPQNKLSDLYGLQTSKFFSSRQLINCSNAELYHCRIFLATECAPMSQLLRDGASAGFPFYGKDIGVGCNWNANHTAPIFWLSRHSFEASDLPFAIT